MKKRHRLSRSGSKKYFTKHARKVHKRNIAPRSMRGGIRL